MKSFYHLIALVFLGLLPTLVSAQYHHLTTEELQVIPALPLPVQDNAALMAQELEARKPGRPITFAVAMRTKVRPSTHGEWTVNGAASIWRLRIKSPGAKTLNLGFSEFNLPPGANLYLLTPDKRYGPFTRADNEDHNQLWTPVMEGDELLVELRVPTRFKKRVQLYLTSVNHDFQGITQKSGACNLDVICGAEDGWEIVDGYRDIIRSVAAYTLNGSDACTGYLVNNVNGDGRPFFMTADHCEVRSDNAPSLVAYWNFESDECRPPGSAASGQLGFGNRNIFNSGATLLATWAGSDVTLTLLDDPVNPNANAYYAGWDANPALPGDTTIAVHHPGVDEKRISFSFNQTFRVNANGTTTNPDGNFLQVPNWSIGTTEGGSSGSPIFDTGGYIRGQLLGGLASCSNDSYDVYGYFPVSWEGAGTPETQLKHWLDPCGTGTLKVDGMEASAVPFALTANGNCRTICAGVPARIEVTAGSGYPEGTSVNIVSASTGIDANLNVNEIVGGEGFDVIVESSANLDNGTYTVVIRAESDAGTDDIELLFNVSEGLAEAPADLFPADGETEVSPFTMLSWEEVDQVSSYEIQLSSLADFSFLTYSGTNITGQALALPGVLEPSTTYFWRVRSVNACGVGEWATYSFATENLSCSGEFSVDTPVTIPSSGTPEVTSRLNSTLSAPIEAIEVTVVIDHTFIGDLDGILTSPAGTSIQLFNPVGNGGCDGANMAVTFSDRAAATSADFNGACSTDPVAVAGSYQPADPLSTFNGEIPNGTWTLAIQDDADFDGGEIVGLRIDFCTSGSTKDFSVQSAVAAIETCNNIPVTFDLLLGEDFGAVADFTASINGNRINGVTTNLDAGNNLLTVTINNWNSVALGNSELQLELTADNGSSRIVALPVSLSRPGIAAALVSPADNSSVPEVDIEFDWAPVTGASSYRLEYARDASFTDMIGTAELVNTSLVVTDLPGGELFWRVITLSPCGEEVSAVNSLTITTNSTQDFGQGRELTVYPNPVRGRLTVEATGSWPGIIRAGLFDAAGRFLAEYQLNGAGRAEWDLGGLAAGVYYLRFSGAGQQRTERLVVLR